MSIERAISIRQPFVELILQGLKREEYRSKPTHIRERVYLYASLQPFPSNEEWVKVQREPGQLPVGLILGSVEIVDCRPDPGSDGYAYVLRNPKRLTTPLKAVNQPQPVFWRPEFPGSGRATAHAPAPRTKVKRAPPQTFEPDAALAAIIGPAPLSGVKIVRQFWAYIVEHNLQDQHDKRMVNTDARLRRLFGGGKQVAVSDMASLLGDHLR